MTGELENKLNQGLDYILDQLSHGNTIEGLKKGRVWMEFEQVKEWKSKFGFQFQIYSNDHFIENKPHFHIVKKVRELIAVYSLTVSLMIVKATLDWTKKFVRP